MYCNGTCQYLNERKHKCELTGEKLSYMKQTGSLSFAVHDHRGICKGDRENGKKINMVIFIKHFGRTIIISSLGFVLNQIINYLLKLNGIYGVLRTLKLKLSATYLTIRSWRKGNEYETNIV